MGVEGEARDTFGQVKLGDEAIGKETKGVDSDKGNDLGGIVLNLCFYLIVALI